MAKKKVRRNVVKGIAHIKASFNNTIITLSDVNGETLCWDSAGTVGFKGARKATPFAATRAAEKVASKAKRMGMREIEVRVKLPGSGRESAITALQGAGLLVSAIRDDDPVVVFEDNSLWFQSGPVPEGEHLVSLGRAAVRREGRDVTLVVIGSTLAPAVAAAETLADEGVSVEVIDPRTLVPLDEETILGSVAKTGRLVIAEPAHRTNGAAAEIAAIVAEKAFDSLQRPVLRVATPDVTIPFSPALEAPLYPNEQSIAAVIRRLV